MLGNSHLNSQIVSQHQLTTIRIPPSSLSLQERLKISIWSSIRVTSSLRVSGAGRCACQICVQSLLDGLAPIMRILIRTGRSLLVQLTRRFMSVYHTFDWLMSRIVCLLTRKESRGLKLQTLLSSHLHGGLKPSLKSCGSLRSWPYGCLRGTTRLTIPGAPARTTSKLHKCSVRRQ